MLISELKNYDLRLEQIKAIMESGDPSLLEHFLKMRIEQLTDQIEKNIQLRHSIERKVHEIQTGGSRVEQKFELMVEAKEFEPVWVLSKTAAIDISQMGMVIGSVFEAIFRNGLQPVGPVMMFYLDEEFHQENANVEVCVPIVNQSEMEKISGVKLLNPGLCATCIYVGAYHKMGKAYAAILKWIEENQYKISYAPFDVYVSDPQKVKNPEELVTQVWFPIRK